MKNSIILPRGLYILGPFVLWLFLMRDFVLDRIPVNMDTNTIYGVVKYYFNNVLNGVVPLWEPFVALGRPFYALAICNLYNPIILLVPLLKLLGINYAQAFVVYMVVYFWIGCVGFYFLADELFKDRAMAYVAYIALMFSSFGASMFTQLTFLEIVIPTIWFFFFLLRFARRQTQGNFLGLSFTVMVLISSYLPFYFITVFLCFLSTVLILYANQALAFCRALCQFFRKHWRLSCVCLTGIFLAAAPLMAYKVLDAGGDAVAPGRHCQYTSPQECYDRTMGRQGGMSFDEITRSGSLGERLDMQDLFGNLDKISYGSDSLLFLPVLVFILMGLSFFLPLRRLTVLFSGMALTVGLVALGSASGLFGILFRHIPLFSYFRNLFFLGAFLGPLVILLGVYQLKLLLEFVPRGLSAKKTMMVGVLLLHALMFVFLKHYEGVPAVSYLTLGLSAVAWCMYLSGLVMVPRPIWAGIFAVIMLLEPVFVLKSYAQNAKEFAAVLPSMHVKPVFAWVRPDKPEIDNSRIYQFVHYEDFWYDMNMTDAPARVGFPQSVARWTFDLAEHTPGDVLARYARYKIVLYDEAGHPGKPVTGPGLGISVRRFDVNELQLMTDFSSPQTVVYNDSYTSSWKAYLDGRPTQLLRVNTAFKGLKVPAGKHVIEFSYHPPGGSWVHLLASVTLFIFLWWAVFMLYWKI